MSIEAAVWVIEVACVRALRACWRKESLVGLLQWSERLPQVAEKSSRASLDRVTWLGIARKATKAQKHGVAAVKGWLSDCAYILFYQKYDRRSVFWSKDELPIHFKSQFPSKEAQALVRYVQEQLLLLLKRRRSVLLSRYNCWFQHIFLTGSAKFTARISIRLPLTSKTEVSFMATINLLRPALLFHHRKLFSGTESKFKARKSRKPDTWITRKQRSASERKLRAKPVRSCVLPDRGRCNVLTRGATHRCCQSRSRCCFILLYFPSVSFWSCLKQGCLISITVSSVYDQCCTLPFWRHTRRHLPLHFSQTWRGTKVRLSPFSMAFQESLSHLLSCFS